MKTHQKYSIVKVTEWIKQQFVIFQLSLDTEPMPTHDTLLWSSVQNCVQKSLRKRGRVKISRKKNKKTSTTNSAKWLASDSLQERHFET